jgi:hypothetical protein
LTTATLELVAGFTALHMQGMCCRDLSERHVTFDPDTGELRLIYADTFIPESQATPAVPERPRFMAPEVVRGEAAPSAQADLHTLAALLFYMLMVHHPLEGERTVHASLLDPATMQQLYGENPVFIFDPNDTSNRPVPGYHVSVLDYWPLYPQAIRDMFTQAFTDGLRDPYGGRIRESEWRKALINLRDTIIYCPQCGAENFYDLAALKASGGKPGTCWSCDSELVLPPRLRIDDTIIMLNYNTVLYPHHVDPDRRYDFSQPVAQVTQHPQNPKIWGLKNLGSEKWVITTDDGTIKDVFPSRSLTLAANLKINFGKREGDIRV